jgi:signal peptidase II
MCCSHSLVISQSHHLRVLLRVLYLTFAVVLFDQVTKLLVKGFSIPLLGYYHEGMFIGQSIPVIGDYLRITYVENPGMAFGIQVAGRLFVTLFSIVASGAIAYYLYRIRNESLVIRLALALILAGAIGNLVDRVFYGVIFGEASLFYGKVVDFIDVDFFDVNFMNFHMTRWAVFNVADAAVSSGVILMLLFHRRFTAAHVGEPLSADSGALDQAGSSEPPEAAS